MFLLKHISNYIYLFPMRIVIWNAWNLKYKQNMLHINQVASVSIVMGISI